MPRHAHYVPHGVIPAVLLPFNDDLSIDEKSFRSHLRDVAAVTRASPPSPSTPIRPRSPPAASMSSGACSRSRRTRSASGSPSSTASGPTAASRRRGSPAWRPTAAPPRCWCSRRRRSRSGQSPEMALAHFKRIADATDLPHHRVPVSARHRPGLSARHAAEDGRAGADDPRHQGLGRQRAAARDAHPHAAEPAAAGERAHHPQRLAVLVAGARLQRAALGLAAA